MSRTLTVSTPTLFVAVTITVIQPPRAIVRLITTTATPTTVGPHSRIGGQRKKTSIVSRSGTTNKKQSGLTAAAKNKRTRLYYIYRTTYHATHTDS